MSDRTILFIFTAMWLWLTLIAVSNYYRKAEIEKTIDRIEILEEYHR